MNEQIKELLKQSCGFEYDEDGNELTPMLVGKDLEKFAQLIVAEVLAVQEKFIANGHNAWHLNKPTREHFGVEE